MYTAFYKLKAKPFQIASDPSFIWLGEKHQEALATLKYGVIDNKGLMLLTGDVGTGKTTLINTLLESLGEDVHFASIPDPRLNLIDFLNYIAQAFHIDSEFESKGAFLLHFGWFLESVYKQNKKVLLIVDEAQLLTQDLLEEIRLLSNINRDGNHLLNIFFVGQNEFNEILHRPENRAVTQRITLNYQLHPLSAEETDLYIRHRLKIANAPRMLFSAQAVRAIAVHSEGIPRRINVICDHCLLTGYIEEKPEIDADIVEECAKDIAIPFYIKAAQPGQGQKHDLPDTKGWGQHKAPPSKGLRTATLLASILLLSIIVATLVSPSLNVSEKFVSTYYNAVRYLVGAFDSPQDGVQQEGTERVSIQSERLPGEDAEADDSSVPLTKEEERIGSNEKSLLLPDFSKPTDSSADENGTIGVSSKGAGSAGVSIRRVKLTPIETAPVTDEPEAFAKKIEKTKGEAEVAIRTKSDVQDQPEPVNQAAVIEVSASEREGVEFSDQSEIVDVHPAPELQTEPVAIRFESNSNEFSTANLDHLAGLALSIRNRQAVFLNISGYTDSVGSADFNNRLSLFRASMVKSYLMGLGIDPDRLNVQGFGSRNPIADNTTEEGRRLNRRVEVEIVYP